MTVPTAEDRLQRMLAELGQAPLLADQATRLAEYLALLMRWNEKTNLTAIRDEDGILRRHFLESILCARRLPAGIRTLLDYGSGAGLPGIPCAICLPGLQVTLAESQGKKAGFLREAVRGLSLTSTVWHGRVEAMDPAVRFDGVTLRAVDRMTDACEHGLERVKAGGWLAVLSTAEGLEEIVARLPGIAWRAQEPLAGSRQEVLLLGRKLSG